MSRTNMDLVPVPMSHGKIRMFDCTICRGSLEQPGPPLESFSFGKLLMSINQLSFSEQDMIYREFNLFDQCFSGGHYDCTKVLSTACGHLYHSGCIREWFFMRRLDRIKKCPFCNQRTNYEECWVIHATACNPDDLEDDDDDDDSTIQYHSPDEKQQIQPNTSTGPDYSDISCASSSFSSDGSEMDGTESEAEDPINDDDHQPRARNTRIENNDTYLYSDDVFINLVDSEFENDVDDDPTYICPCKRTQNKGIVKQAFQFVDKFNMIYTLLLRSTIRSACCHYQTRKLDFSKMLSILEDEELVEEEDQMVSLGYDFIAQLMTTALLIWIIERVRNTFRKQ